MLDKSIPFYTIIMRRPYAEYKDEICLPDGYSLRSYQPGDELGWAEIETSVLEFDNVEQAIACHMGYHSKMNELKKRQWFIENKEGLLVATATGWILNSEKNKIPVVHALGCRPDYQKLGLGKAVAAKMIKTFCELDPGLDVWLDTQTWSYEAVGLYMKLGFIPMVSATYNKTENEFKKALPVLKEKLKPGVYEQFCKLAE